MRKPADLVPEFLKRVIRPVYIPIYYRLKKMTTRHKSRDELHRYWKEPWDGANFPQDYLEGENKSQFLVQLIKGYVNSNARIMEIGCGVGRNLNYLFSAGFTKLEGIEISENYVEVLKQSYPEMARHCKVYNKSAEEIIGQSEDETFDVVFTMAVLQHIHTESEFIFPEIVRITKKFLITIEDEKGISWRHFPRNYRTVFESLGLEQLEEFNCGGIPQLSSNFFGRVFRKP